jgi:hypothetical protein
MVRGGRVVIRHGNASVAAGEAVVESSIAADLEAFDALPLPIREAIRDHRIRVAARPLLDFWTDADGASGLDCRERMAAILSALEAQA